MRLMKVTLKYDPWMIATFVLAGLTLFSFFTGFNLTGFSISPTNGGTQSGEGLEAFVVSYCPYGLQMQRILAAVEPALGNDVDITVRYMGEVVNGEVTAMHGAKEAEENLRQICIREEQSNKFWNYLSCFMEAGDTSGCLSSVGIDQNSLNACMSDSSRGVAYAQIDFELADAALDECANVKGRSCGSPTLTFNGEFVSEYDYGGRTANAVKELICDNLDNKPAGCSQTLSTDNAATSFSETYSSSGGSTSGSC